MSVHYKPTSGRSRETDSKGRVQINETMQRLQLEVGAFIREKREALGITQKELGRLIGVTNNHISDIENGHRKVSPERYMEFVKILGLDREAFGKMVLLHYDPVTYRLLFGGRKVEAILSATPDRIAGWEP